MKEKCSITGMSCAACSAGIEKTVKKLDGVLSVNVSLMDESMLVEYDEGRTDIGKILSAVQSLGYGATVYDEKLNARKHARAGGLKIRFFLSLVLLLPLMYFSMGEMLSLPLPSGYVLNFTLQMLLTVAIIGVNFKFFTSGARALFKRVPNMDTLVSLGALASFLYSFVLTVQAYANKISAEHIHLFYESAGMILTLVTLGKWLEEKSKRKTGEEVEKLIKLMPSTVTVEKDGQTFSLPFSQLSVGDILLVKQGDYVPVDGEITWGNGFVDRSAITGESMPIEVGVGDKVTGADVVTSGVLRVRAEKVGADSTLSRIVKMVKEAGASKAPLQKVADKIAGVFVPAVVLIAAVTFFVWLWLGGGVSAAANYAVSVLVISCPCSLGLATPVAVMAATGKGMSLGILFKDAEALQKAREINCALLDKTATLTVGKPQVTDFLAIGQSPQTNAERESALLGEEFCLSMAAAIESYSNHPLAECIKAYANERSAGRLSVSEFRYEIGKGGTAFYAGEKYYLGNRKLLPQTLQKAAQKTESEYQAQGKTTVFLANEKELLALFAVADVLKESSQEAITALKKRGVRTAMLTGDSENVAKAIAEKVGIDEYFAEALPEDKAKAVSRVRAMGGNVAMVGDGINDSPALKEADLGVAMGTGTDIAIDSADVVLASGDLRSLAVMLDLSKAAVRNIKQNLFWAFFYNCAAIPVAAGAFAFAGLTLNPMIAAACMSLSSLFVVGNALRLTRFGGKNKSNLRDGARTERETDSRSAPRLEAQPEPETIENTTQAVESSLQKRFFVGGMSCMHCVNRVKKAILSVAGVQEAEVSLEENAATVRLVEGGSAAETDEIFEKIKLAVVDAGYEISEDENAE